MATSAAAQYASQNNVDYLANINKWIDENRNATPDQVNQQMSQYGVTESDIVKALAQRTDLAQGSTLKLGDTFYQPNFQVTGSGENEQVGALENIFTYKSSENKTGGKYNQYLPSGEVERTGNQQKVDNNMLPFLLATGGMMFGLPDLSSVFSGGAGAATTFAGEALADAGLLSGASLTAGLTPELIAAAEAGLPLTPSLTAGLTPLQIAAAEAALPASTGLLSSTIPAAAATIPAAAATIPAAAVTPTVNPLSTLTSLLPGASGLLSSLTAPQISQLISGGLGTAGNLLQMQQSREATQAAQARVDAETAAAKEAAQFRPVGTTTRFGTSEFTYDPVTGRMVSSGYQLTPEAKAQQDRLMALSNAGLTQAELAQAQFAPLQTGAQNLFGLGNKYLAQSPEEVAQKYISQQMNLLAPSRELDLANLQNRLFQQGRSGLAVSQGGNLGATTPELQALYNARAQQDAQLAANAQQYGQQQVSFGAGLLGTGAQTMGQYYGGQQASYAPYQAAMGQVQNLEAQAQQPYNMSLALAQQQANAGANAGRLGLTGAQLSTNLATSADATRNLGAQALIAAGNPNAQFGQALGNVFGGLLTGGVPPMTAMSTPATGYGAGNYYGNQDVLGVWS